MNDNGSQCGTRRYIDPPLPNKVSKVVCVSCQGVTEYVWCQVHDKICVSSLNCTASGKSKFDDYDKRLTEKELLMKLIGKTIRVETICNNFTKRFDSIDKKLEELENMIKYSPGSEIYNSAKTEFENLGKS